MESTIYIIFALIIGIVVFLVLRELNCWYWKINESIKLKEKQNLLLERILFQLGGAIEPDFEQAVSKEKESDNPLFSELSEEEREQVEKFLKFGLKEGEKLVINKKTRQVDRFDQKEWAEIVSKYQESDWIILSS